MKWNMKALFEFVEIKYGKPHGTLLAEVLFSLMWKLNIVRYHTDKSKESISSLLGRPEEVDPGDIIGGVTEGSALEKGKCCADSPNFFFQGLTPYS